MNAAKIDSGFVEVEAGSWLMSRGQPAAFFGTAIRRRRKGWCVRDRAALEQMDTTGVAKCADSSRPFLTHIPCAAPVFAVSSKVLVSPLVARREAHTIKTIPMSLRGSFSATEFANEWVVMATAGRTARIPLDDGQTLSVRPESLVAWTGGRPTGFCRKIGILDILLPRGPRDLLLTFYGPGVVWVEGVARKNALDYARERRVYGV